MNKTDQKLNVTLKAPGLLIPDLHYGPYSYFWWIYSAENNITSFPIRVGQQTKVSLKGRDFILTIKRGTRNRNLLPEYHCKSEQFEAVENNPTKAISTVYAQIFNTKTRYSGYIIMGWTDETILATLKKEVKFFPRVCLVDQYEVFVYAVSVSSQAKWMYAGTGFQSSINHIFQRKQAIFVSRIQDDKCILEIYQDSKLRKQFVGANPNEVWKLSGLMQKYSGTRLFGLEDHNIQELICQIRIPACQIQDWANETIMTPIYNYHVKQQTLANIKWHQFFTTWMNLDITIIELEPTLKVIYPSQYEFRDHEYRAWQTMLHHCGCTNVTPWSRKKSKVIIKKKCFFILNK